MSTHYTGPSGTGSSASVSDFAHAAQDKLSDTVDQAQTVAKEQYDRLALTIRRHPLQAAGIAAGVGFVLALLARR
jgi:ElaB/YqjD/DUF883 family membrane-anchored ribosome-binding protein